MTKTISVKVDDDTWIAMRAQEEVNWSGVIRKSIRQFMANAKHNQGTNQRAQPGFNKDQALKAFEDARRISKLITGRKGEDIIREWRDKRR